MNTKPVILIVEDDPAIRQALSDGLGKSGYATVVASTAEEALSKLDVVSVHLALVDYRLPGMSGVDLLRELRQRSTTIELVIMTANPSVESAIEALRLDASDYLLKPFALNQVEQVVRRGLERRRQQIRRKRLLRQMERDLAGLQELEVDEHSDSSVAETPSPAKPALLTFGPIEIDLRRRQAYADRRELYLTPTEFNLLMTLADSAPAAVAYETLLEQATGYRASALEARELVKWHIYHLRRKLEEDPKKPRYIINVRGLGYRLADQ